MVRGELERNELRKSICWDLLAAPSPIFHANFPRPAWVHQRLIGALKGWIDGLRFLQNWKLRRRSFFSLRIEKLSFPRDAPLGHVAISFNCETLRSTAKRRRKIAESFCSPRWELLILDWKRWFITVCSYFGFRISRLGVERISLTAMKTKLVSRETWFHPKAFETIADAECKQNSSASTQAFQLVETPPVLSHYLSPTLHRSQFAQSYRRHLRPPPPSFVRLDWLIINYLRQTQNWWRKLSRAEVGGEKVLHVFINATDSMCSSLMRGGGLIRRQISSPGQCLSSCSKN